MIELAQTITLLTGLILMLVAGYQDFKTHKPTLIMPALILIGLSQSIIIGIIIFIFAVISLFFLPNSVNKVFGKADIFFIASTILILLTLNNIIISTIIILSSIYALIGIIYYIKSKPNELIPWVGIYTLSFFIALITSPILMIIGGL
jgi:hypothetical protein